MHNYLIAFENMDWDNSATGVFQKCIIQEGYQLRLLRFDEHFFEEAWCEKSHKGYVIEGEMDIDFENTTLSYKAGDGLWIPSGPKHKHKARIAKGKYVLIILFESDK